MVYRPARRKVEFNDPKGIARIKQGKKKGTLIVWFSEDNDNDFAGKKFKVAEWPDFIQKTEALEGKEWYIRLNNSEDGIYSISPQSGMFTGKVQKFSSSENSPPVPKLIERVSSEGKPYSYLQFIALIEIVDGDKSCIGMVMPYYLRYNFAEKKETDEYGKKGEAEYTDWGSASAKHTPKLDEFLVIAGAWDAGPVKFEDNILPKLQKRISKVSKTFKFVVKNGWIDTLYADSSTQIDNDDDPFWEEDAEEKPKKTKKKKSKKAKVEEDVPFDWKEDDE